MKPRLLHSRFTFYVSRSLLALCLIASSRGPLSAQTLNIPELERLEAAHVKEVSEKVDAPFLAGLQRLNDSYRATLETSMKKAVAQGALDETLAFQTESKLFAAENKVPDQDEPGLNASVAKLRSFFRVEAARLMKSRVAGLQPLDAAYLGSLRTLEKDLTRAAKIDEALAVRTRVNTLAVQAAAAPPEPAGTVAPPVASAAQQPGITVAPFARPVDKVDLYATGNNVMSIYLNNKEILPKVGREGITKARIALKEGDVIAFISRDRFDLNSFWLSCLAPTGEFLFDTSLAWKCYLPEAADKWWDTKKITDQQPVQEAPDTQDFVGQVKMIAAFTPAYHGGQPIRSVVKDDTGRASYVMYTVTKADLLPKKVAPSLVVNLTDRSAPFLGKTVRIATAKAGQDCLTVAEAEPTIGPYAAANAAPFQFKIGRGTQMGSLVFESIAKPGMYLRHEFFRLHLVKGIAVNSCFYLPKPLAGTDGYSLSAQTHPNHFLMVNDQGGVNLVQPGKMKDISQAVVFLEPVPAK